MGKRFACFTPDQQKIFDGLNGKQQKYVLYRGQGLNKTDAYEKAGYHSKQMGVGAYHLEEIVCPQMKELIGVLSGHQKRADFYKEGTDVAKVIDKKAEELPIEVSLLFDNSSVMEQPLPNVEKFGDEDARRLQFYRQIANGTIKTVKVTKTYDKDGNITGSKREETSDIDTRIKARKEIDRILGLTDVLDLGQITGGDIKITIVDASKKEQVMDDQRGEIVGETADNGTK